MNFDEVKNELLNGAKISRKNWGTSMTKFYLQIIPIFVGKVPEPDDFLELCMKTVDDEFTIIQWRLTDIDKKGNDWFILSDDRQINIGWKCPDCGRVYSPSVIECYNCNNKIQDDICNCDHDIVFNFTDTDFECKCIKCGKKFQTPIHSCL